MEKRVLVVSGDVAPFWAFLNYDWKGLYKDTNTPEMLQANEPYLAVLSLFCQCSSLLLSIADDDEFFEREHPFTIEGKLWFTSSTLE